MPLLSCFAFAIGTSTHASERCARLRVQGCDTGIGHQSAKYTMQRGVEFVYTANWIPLALSNALMVGMTHAEWRGRSQRGKGRTESFSTTIRDHSTSTQRNVVLPLIYGSRARNSSSCSWKRTSSPACYIQADDSDSSHAS
jgi:hypothetical protein